MTWEQQQLDKLRAAPANLQTARDEIDAMLGRHRCSSTRNIHTGEYKNPVRQGYDRGLSEALAVIDTLIERGSGE